MDSTEQQQQPVLESLPPSAQLALRHAQAEAAHAGVDTTTVDEPVVPSADDPVVVDNTAFADPLIAGDYPTPIGKPVAVAPVKKEKKKDAKLDLSSESAFPSLSSAAAPRSPVVSGWSTTASRVKSQPVSGRTHSPAAGSPGTGKKAATSITDVLELPANQQIVNQPSKPLGFKSSADVLQQVMSKTSTNIIASTNRVGTTTFLIQGNPTDVAKAKRELVAGLVVKRTVEVMVPSSTRRFIIGTKGSTLKQIETKSGTRINMPPRKEGEEPSHETEIDEMVPITIVGDAAGINIAKSEIEKIVGEKAAKQTIRVDTIDPCYHLFLAGPHDSAVKNLESELNVKIQMPAIGLIQGTTTDDGETKRETGILITGDKDKVLQAKQSLEDRYAELQKTHRSAAIGIPKRQHKYLYGKNGATLKEILNECGCTVELPPLDDPSENVTIRGPDERLINGLSLVMEKARSVHVNVLDLAEMHKSAPNSLQHGQCMLKYLLAKGSLKTIENEQKVQVGTPTAKELKNSVPLEFVSKNEKDAAEGYKAGFELCRALTPELFATVNIEPHLYRHIRVRHAKALQRIKSRHGVEVIVPKDNEEEDPIFVVFESKDEALDRQQSLEGATAELMKIASDLSDFVSKTIQVPSEYHRLITGPKGTTLNAIIGGDESTATVRFGGASKDDVIVRGLTNEVSHIIAEINKVYEAAKHEEFVNSYTTEFSIPANYSAHVIGKTGTNINKLKEDLGVKIDIGDAAKGGDGFESASKSGKKGQQQVKVVIQGIKTNVEAAKERILALVNTLADQVTLTLNVPKEFHRFLIGPNGRYVKKLEDKYNVFVKFPHSKGDASPSTDTSGAITIRGRKKDASSAKEELVELYEYEKEEQEKRREREAKHRQYEEKRAAAAAAKESSTAESSN